VTHEEARDLIAAYALDALPSEEAVDLESHLAACERCRRELAEFRETAALLATAVERREPPAGLREQILRTIRPPSRRVAWQSWALAAAAVIILALGGLDLSLARQVADLDARAAAQTQTLALLMNPTSKTVALSGSAIGTVRLIFSPAGGPGALVATGMPDLAPGLVYEVWLISGTTPKGVGVFRPAPGQSVVVIVGGDVASYQTAAITVEHGASVKPTSTPIFAGTIPRG
jgi:anti-sigma factor RsiW